MRLHLWAALCLAALPVRAAESATSPMLEVYGTKAFTAEQIQEKYRRELSEIIHLRRARARVGDKKAREMDARVGALKGAVEAGARGLGDFALVRLDSYERSSEPGETYLTLEVVEAKDKAARMPFRPAPGGRVPESSGLIEAWWRYVDLGRELVRKGDIPTDRASCQAFYCSFGDRTPALKELFDRFVEQVPAQKAVLARVLRDDKDPSRRAAAVYLLAHLKEANEVLDQARFALMDPEARVREAALDVFTDAVLHHPGLPVPVETIAGGLDYPSAEDRRRALAFMLSLADKPEYRPFMVKQAMPQVLRLLRVRHPAIREMAHTVLGLLSGEDHPPGDVDAWEQWAFRARSQLEAQEKAAMERAR